MINSLLYFLVGVIEFICLAVTWDACKRILKTRDKGQPWKHMGYLVGIYVGMAFFTCVASLTYYMIDSVYCSGLLFIAPFVLASAVCIGISGWKDIRYIYLITCATWVVWNAVFNYIFNNVMSTAFFTLTTYTGLVIFCITLIAIGIFVILGMEILVNPDKK